MSTHSYSLRSRISSTSLNGKSVTPNSLSKTTKSPRKPTPTACTLQLKHVIGTTTTTPGGLSCCDANNSYAYCAGSVVVLTQVNADNVVNQRYFKARPTVLPVNHTPSFYDAPITPTQRKSTVYSRRAAEDYSPGSFARDWPEEGGGLSWSARERIKAASCVSISPDGRVMAVGETGYNPRVLLFSTAANSPSDTPLSIITDHTIGVRNVAFSPNSKYLATLGDVNDGYLYIWQTNTKTGVIRLHSSNKCTTNVCDMTWIGSNVVTVGTRHIKVWQTLNKNNVSPQRRTRIGSDIGVPSPGPVPLQGRNCLLGAFADVTFTSIVALSETRAVVCADDGLLGLLDLSHNRVELSMIDRVEPTIAAISFRPDVSRLIWTGEGGDLSERDVSSWISNTIAPQSNTPAFDKNKRRGVSRQSLLRQSLGLSPPKLAHTVALGSLGDKLVCIDAEGMVRVAQVDTFNIEVDIHRTSSHNGLIKGVQQLSEENGLGSFFTWAGSGEINFWDRAGNLVRAEMVDLDDNMNSEDMVVNELRVVRHSAKHHLFITGDQFGVMTVIEQNPWSCSDLIRAHSAEISDIDFHETDSLVATCSRDRTVQIFALNNQKIELLQTSDDHISAVTQVLFDQSGCRLLSCSADRTVVIRDRIERKVDDQIVSAFIAVRTVSLKASPLSMSFLPPQQNILVVSTMDRYVVRVDLATGSTLAAFKVSEKESDDTVTLNAICMGGSNLTNDGVLLAGYSAIDKSVRLYDLEKGSLLGRDSGHTEGISDLTMLEERHTDQDPRQCTIVSTGLDGTIMIWSATAAGRSLTTPQQELSQTQAFGIEPRKAATPINTLSVPPLRKILSKLDIADFGRQRSPTREVSPGGLRRRTSRLALTTSIDEVEESPSVSAKTQPQEKRQRLEKRSPSPPLQAVMRLHKQRSGPELRNGFDLKSQGQRDLSPSSVTQNKTVTTLRQSTRANNSRLRKPPSVPNDLRAHAAVQVRRQSVSNANDTSTLGTVTEHISHILRNYDKKLLASNDQVDLNNVEADLENLLKTVKQKKFKQKSRRGVTQPRPTKQALPCDIDELSTLLQTTNLT